MSRAGCPSCHSTTWMAESFALGFGGEVADAEHGDRVLGERVLSPIWAQKWRWQWPAITAADMPAKKPLSVESGVSKSACASSQTAPQQPCSNPARTPRQALQQPARTTGGWARATARRTIAASCPLTSAEELAVSRKGSFGWRARWKERVLAPGTARQPPPRSGAVPPPLDGWPASPAWYGTSTRHTSTCWSRYALAHRGLRLDCVVCMIVRCRRTEHLS